MSLVNVARQFAGAMLFNALNVRTIPLFFQRSPGKPSGAGDVRGIDKLRFQVLKNGKVIQKGMTGPDGKIQMRIQGGVSTLHLIASAAVAEYTVSIRDAAIEAENTASGQQHRLRMLGYHVDHTGPDGNGVDGAVAPTTNIDRALLEFQADDATIVMNSLADATTQPKLKAATGA
jgi:hypothetical protein